MDNGNRSRATTPEPHSLSDDPYGVNMSWSQGHTPPTYKYLTATPPADDVHDTEPFVDPDELAVEKILTGSRYANGGQPSDCPILTRHAKEWDLESLALQVDFTTVEEDIALNRFARDWRTIAQNHRRPGTIPNAVEQEQTFVLLLLMGSIPAMAKAMAARRIEDQQALVDTMRRLVDGLEVLKDIHETVRREAA